MSFCSFAVAKRRQIPDLLYLHLAVNLGCPGGGGYSRMEQTGMLVVSLRGVNFGFGSLLGYSGQSANILCVQGLV